MFRALGKTIVFTLYAVVIILGVVFAVGNRTRVDISLFPVPYNISIPVFLFALAVFAVGALLGWFTLATKLMQSRKKQRDAGKRIAALENELVALRTEQLSRIPVQL